jgi:hypothetical protein
VLQTIQPTPIDFRVRWRQFKDTELLKLEEELVEAQAAWLRALDCRDEADRRYYIRRSSTTTNGGRPSDATVRRMAGVRAAERAVEQTEKKVGRLINLMLRKRAWTLAGMACKLRILHVRPAAAVMSSIEADLAAMGLLPLHRKSC